MKIIAELARWNNFAIGCYRFRHIYPTGREGTARGPYAGCVGYFSFNGNLDTCITIRTALLKDGQAYVQAVVLAETFAKP